MALKNKFCNILGALRVRALQLPVAHGLKADPRRNARREAVSVLQDDASRFVTGYGISDEAATENALAVLDKAIGNHGRPASIMTDHGSRMQWYNTSGPTCHLTGTTRRRRYRRL